MASLSSLIGIPIVEVIVTAQSCGLRNLGRFEQQEASRLAYARASRDRELVCCFTGI